MKLIPLNQGMNAIVDNEDFEMLSKYHWCAFNNGSRFYVQTKINSKNVYMHRFILNPSKYMSIDHKNGNGLDNRRTNLRICTQSQNSANSVKNKNNNSGFKGVYWDKERKRWMALIRFNYQRKYLGRFNSPQEAHTAYIKAAQKYFGEFARSE